MEPIKKKLTLPKKEYYTRHLSIVNVFLPVKMTPKEIEVLAGFMSFEGEIAEQRFGTTARKLVMDSMGIKPGGLGNYLRGLKTKGFLKELGHNDFEILAMLFPNKDYQNYMFQLINAG